MRVSDCKVGVKSESMEVCVKKINGKGMSQRGWEKRRDVTTSTTPFYIVGLAALPSFSVKVDSLPFCLAQFLVGTEQCHCRLRRR